MYNRGIPINISGVDPVQQPAHSNNPNEPGVNENNEPPEPYSIDVIIEEALEQCNKLPASYSPFKQQIHELHSRLAFGRLHLAVVGEFNRGKSTFINSLIGMKLLPTSVIPITSVPTAIRYGQDVSCSINFLNDMPAIVVTTSPESVTATLYKYVAEESNPKNQYCVRSVDVTVPAPLLENGTVLIDTPGFGSTFLHNTQTALSALNDCDAALFLLSVDPPMTQTEVEFLKMVINQVPRIFFIINKIDLLSKHDLVMVDGFVRDILTSKIPPTIRPHIFKISALYASKAKSQSLSDPFWANSGMEVVKNNIIGFMAREKYFTLSQALTDKLKTSITGILTSLHKQLSAFTDPVTGMTIERNEIAKETESVKKSLAKELSIVAAEKKAMTKFFEENLSAGRLKLISQIHGATDNLLHASSCSAESIAGILTAVNKIIPEALYTFKFQIISDLNRPLKRAMLLHEKEYTTTMESIRTCLAGTGSRHEGSLYDKLDAIEFAPEKRTENVSSENAIQITLNFSDFFLSRQEKTKRLHTRYSQQLDEITKTDLSTFSKSTKNRIDTLFSRLGDLLNDEYQQLIQQLDQYTTRKEQSIAAHKEKTDASVAALNLYIEAFKKVMTRFY